MKLYGANAFQFHKGAIKTRARPRYWIILRCFNSIKVRLKLKAASLTRNASLRFNSIKVRLKLLCRVAFKIKK